MSLKTRAITVRVEDAVKEQAEMMLEDMGINMTTYVVSSLKALIREKRIPFEMVTSQYRSDQVMFESFIGEENEASYPDAKRPNLNASFGKTLMQRSLMHDNEEIAQLVSLVVEVADPDKIILFGSYAYGSPSDNSDLDLLVIKNGKDFSRDDHADLETALFLKRKQHNLKTRYDVFFQTERQAAASAENGGAFVDALQKGKIVYERVLEQESGVVS